jgi:hypothetical protein
MTAPSVLRAERINVIEGLEEVLFSFPTVDPEELNTQLRRTGTASPGSPPIPKDNDVLGVSYYFAIVTAEMAKALVAQQERIAALEGQLSAKPPR